MLSALRFCVVSAVIFDIDVIVPSAVIIVLYTVVNMSVNKAST